MSGRRNANRIRGPQSALTDFLAANNISAQQIRTSYEQRTQAADQQNATVAAEQEELLEELDELEDDSPPPEPSKKKRKRGEEKKEQKPTKRTKKSKKKGSDYDSDDDFEDSLGKEMYTKSRPAPGQFDNCEICEKRFTVTAYSKTGPEGGLVCGPCGRELAKDEKTTAPKAKKQSVGKGRRKTESNRLDGIVTGGAKSLQQMCIEKVADYHNDIEEFGDLPENVLERLSEIFSKRRVIDPRTLRLFLRPDLDTIAIPDAANLEVDDYKQIFAVVPNLKKLALNNAGQFKDEVMEYMTEKATKLIHLKMYGANLLTNELWKQFFEKQGHKLETLQLAWLDAAFDDDVVEVMVKQCTSLRRLKIKWCRRLVSYALVGHQSYKANCLQTAASLRSLAELSQLQHLSLHISHSTPASDIAALVSSVGQGLQTLSLEGIPEADDEAIHAIRMTCPNLTKLRLTNLDSVTDAALGSLFGNNPEEPTVLPPLQFLDLNSARDVDNNNPDGPEDVPIGLASESFKALMSHSGSKIERLHIPSCRHISNATMWEMFIGSGSKPHHSDMLYPTLKEINCSFVPGVDTSMVVGMFKSCPKLKKIVAFGCFHIEEVKVPPGVALIGVPRAQDAIEQFGDATMAAQESFLGALKSVGGGMSAGRPIEVGA